MRKSRIPSVLLAALLLITLLVPALAAPTEDNSVTILFTHDLHSHLLPSQDASGQSYGGYARLKTAIDAQKALHPDAILVDGGDFSMGSLFQTIYATDAAELRMMGLLGYDALTFGNHEYDYRAAGFASMLNAAADSGDPLPALVEANYLPPQEDTETRSAMDRCGAADYTVISRGGVNFAVFGIMGKDSDACAPLSGMVLTDPAEAAQRVVQQIEAEVPEPRVVVCLSHSGTDPDPKKSEDTQLAKAVDGIDVIVSGHTHTTLETPLTVNGTYIVSAGEYCHNLGVLTLRRTGSSLSLADYQLLPIDDTLAEDARTADAIDRFQTLVETRYLSQFGGWTFNQVLAENPYTFDTLEELGKHQESTLGNLIADSYRWAVAQAEGPNAPPVDFALTANGVIRGTLPTGALTVADVFNVSSLGIGADGVPGYPLVSVWITGKDLKNAFEVDASVTDLMPAAQLYFTGMTFTYNPHRMIFNKVTDCAQVTQAGQVLPIADDKLYRVVTGLYCGQMLGAVNRQSYGMLSITPLDAQGQEIHNLEDYIVHNPDGSELKEWYALASYLQNQGTVSSQYAKKEGRKNADPSWNPISLCKNPNAVTFVAAALGLGAVLLMVFLARQILRRRR